MYVLPFHKKYEFSDRSFYEMQILHNRIYFCFCTKEAVWMSLPTFQWNFLKFEQLTTMIAYSHLQTSPLFKVNYWGFFTNFCRLMDKKIIIICSPWVPFLSKQPLIIWSSNVDWMLLITHIHLGYNYLKKYSWIYLANLKLHLSQ